MRVAIVEYRAIGDASRNLGVDIIRAEEGGLAPEAFRNRFHSCRQPPNHFPGLTATEDHVRGHVLQRVHQRHACAVTARKIHSGSQRDSGSD